MKANIPQKAIDDILSGSKNDKESAKSRAALKRSIGRIVASKGVEKVHPVLLDPNYAAVSPLTSATRPKVVSVSIPLGDLLNDGEIRDILVDRLTNRLTDKLMEHFERIMNGEEDDFEFADEDKDLCAAVLTQIREKQLKAMFAEQFKLEEKLIGVNLEQIKELKAELEEVLAKMSSITEEIRIIIAKRSALSSRIERCQENYEWHLPQKISRLSSEATQYEHSMEEYSGKRREAMKKKHGKMLEDIKACKKELRDAKLKQDRLTSESEMLDQQSKELECKMPELEARKSELSKKIKDLEQENERLSLPTFVFWRFDEGVILTTNGIKNDLIDNMRELNNREISQSISWTVKLNDYRNGEGVELSDYDITALVRFFILATRLDAYKIEIGEGAEHLRPVIEKFMP